MSLSTIFSQLDANILTISGIFVGVWLTVHFSLFEATDDLSSIRSNVICSIANTQTDTQLIGFIDTLRKISYVLVLEPKQKSNSLKKAIIIFSIASVFAVFHKPLSSNIIFWPDADYFYFFYVFALGAVATYLYIEIRYFREFRRLQKEYPISSLKSEELHITVL